ncbi:MAG TPA: Xaa-Pro peptidase family protein [Candidatus Limnocylindrales bacterium]
MTDARNLPAAVYSARLSACRDAIVERAFGALLIGVGPDLRYLTGFVGEPMERLTLLVVPAKGQVSFVVPRLEAAKAQATPPAAAGQAEVVPFEETDDAFALTARLLAATSSTVQGSRPIGLSDRLWAMHVLGLQRALPDLRFEPASTVLRDLRQVKDADELRLLRLAAQAADRTVDAIAAGRLVGRTENEIGREIRGRLIDEGHDLADFAIVGSGPNGASPHHDASERLIRAGEPVVLDLGGILAGYLSDTTRTIWVAGQAGHEPDPEFHRVYDLVREAQARATAAVKPGVSAESIDTAARLTIASAGYGDYFTHRTGHGIGLEVHEDPYIVAGNATPLRAGMAFSVEPGIYLPGRWGVRLENIVACTEDGVEVLNRSGLDLRVVAG